MKKLTTAVFALLAFLALGAPSARADVLDSLNRLAEVLGTLNGVNSQVNALTGSYGGYGGGNGFSYNGVYHDGSGNNAYLGSPYMNGGNQYSYGQNSGGQQVIVRQLPDGTLGLFDPMTGQFLGRARLQ